LGGYYFGSIMQGVHQAARAAGARLIAIQGVPAAVRAPSFAWDQVDGWLVVQRIDGIEAIAQHGKPIVTAGDVALELGCPAVKFDNRGGIYQATSHLIDHGHTRIAIAIPLEDGVRLSNDMQQSMAGYQAALADRGVPFDPDLVIHGLTPDPNQAYFEPGGRAAAQLLLDRGLPCTAVVCGVDLVALGLMESMQAAGVRIPEDLAVTGFDDLEKAQHAAPPLTSVSIHFSKLGSIAAEILLAQIAGQATPVEITYTPAALIRRRSCGCDITKIFTVADTSAVETGTDTSLARQLVGILRYPLPHDPAVDPAQVWLGVGLLLDSIDATLAGKPAAIQADLYRAWREAVALAKNIEILHTVFMLIQRAAEKRAAADSAARIATTELIERMHVELLRAVQAHEASITNNLNSMVTTNQRISIGLLNSESGQTRSLDWLRQTTANWGCLGLWINPASETPSDLVITGIFNREGDAPTPVGHRCSVLAFPPAALLPDSTLAGGPDLVKLIPVRTAQHDWGVLAICSPMESWVFQEDENASMWAAQIGAALEREALLTSLVEQQESLRQAYERQQALTDTVRDLSSPIIPLLEGVLLVPLVGAVDSLRAQQFIEAVLEGVNSHHAEVVLVDISGVPIVDTHVASTLIQAARATTLLGARVILVGIRPEIAQSIVGLGIDLQGITTEPTLAAALTALQRRRAAATKGRATA
ncbi:MAG: substrate-binding domain-containing protein, partial [Roseiflexaceae bacterium]